MIEFLLQHQLWLRELWLRVITLALREFWVAAGMYWIFSAAVSSMPDPKAGGSAGYLWLYRFLHTTAGNITTALVTAARYRACASRDTRIPGFKIVGPLLLAPLVFPTAACTAHYVVHPGALNVADSAAYETLLVAEAAIDQARVENQTRTLPSAEKDALNTLIRSYNVARDSWLTYRGAVATNVQADPYFQQLTKNLTDLTNAIRAFHERLRVQARQGAAINSINDRKEVKE
jgi:hypothetical protein